MKSLRPNNDEFKNKVVIITGGATGIGLACAKLFARREASVAIFGNSEKDLNSAYKELKTYSSNVITIFADVSKEKSLNDAFLDFDRHCDTLSILVCNAAIQPYGTVEKTPVKVWDKVQDTNIRGAFLSAQESIPRMRNVGGGSIINITSAQGSATQERVAAYSTSKGGLLALTRAIAVDHAGDKIRANSVSPGCIDAPMTKYAASQNTTADKQRQLMETWGRMQPLGRMGTAEEVAEVVTFLGSDRASFCTGADFRVDGGLMASLGVKLPDLN